MSRGKVSAEARLAAAKACAEGRMSQSEAARRIGVNRSNVREWTALYKEKGAAAFEKADRNPEYSAETKLQAVKEYLGGEGSLKIIAAKYGLHTKSTLLGWIKVYNSGGDFRRRGSGGSRMTTGRKTTQEERITIAKECLENECNYEAISRKYNVSYDQVYSWVKKFKEFGEAGLEDRRGKRTEDQVPRTAEEELKIRIAQLEHELYMTKLERDLLKKLDELERRDASHK